MQQESIKKRVSPPRQIHPEFNPIVVGLFDSPILVVWGGGKKISTYLVFHEYWQPTALLKEKNVE